MSNENGCAEGHKDSSIVVQNVGALTVENAAVTASADAETTAEGAASAEKRSGQRSAETGGGAAVQEEESCTGRREQPVSNMLKLSMIVEQISDAGSKAQSPSQEEGNGQSKVAEASTSAPESTKNLASDSKEAEPQPTRCSSVSSWQWSIPALILCPLLGGIALWFSVKSHKHLSEGELYEARWSGKIARFAAVVSMAVDGVILAFIIAVIVGLTQ